jgi:hypothetical protein
MFIRTSSMLERGARFAFGGGRGAPAHPATKEET